jgi:hypothetical protein
MQFYIRFQALQKEFDIQVDYVAVKAKWKVISQI